MNELYEELVGKNEGVDVNNASSFLLTSPFLYEKEEI